MDSLTQFALGSVVGCAVMKETSPKIMLWSGIVATIPDLDVFLKPFYADGNFVVVHRSFSHSILATLILSACLARFTLKEIHFWRRLAFYFSILFTHALLDCCTTYGTQLFWPFDRRLISFNNIHVIEPIYTCTLIFPLLWGAFSKKRSAQKLKFIYLAIGFSMLYLTWTFVAKSMVKTQVVENLNKQKITYEQLLITPTPFNSLLWKAIVKNDSIYYFGSYSLLDKQENITFYPKKHQPNLLANIDNYCDTETMLRHCDGFPFVEGNENKINIYAVKFGPANYIGAPQFIMPFQATKSGADDYDFKIIDNRFEASNLADYQEQLVNRIFYYSKNITNDRN